MGSLLRSQLLAEGGPLTKHRLASVMSSFLNMGLQGHFSMPVSPYLFYLLTLNCPQEGLSSNCAYLSCSEMFILNFKLDL